MTENARQGRLTIRPTNQTDKIIKPGRHSLSFEDGREALLYVPAGYKSETPAPFALMLHGAGGNAEHGIRLLESLADEFGIILLAPKSFYGTWDVIADEYGADVEFINRALAQAFELCLLDENRLAVGGFSDGASYALSLGLTNGDLFSHIVAFSPGFMAPTRQAGTPRIYISHGADDRVLPIERCSRRIVPQLQRAKYDVTYKEFDGQHTIPPDIVRQAVDWFTK
jgi:phospholipase/carboxylesterase